MNQVYNTNRLKLDHLALEQKQTKLITITLQVTKVAQNNQITSSCKLRQINRLVRIYKNHDTSICN